jgi:hypothetical protein
MYLAIITLSAMFGGTSPVSSTVAHGRQRAHHLLRTHSTDRCRFAGGSRRVLVVHRARTTRVGDHRESRSQAVG